MPENEGQHLQSVYPSARSQGGLFRFGLDPKSYMTESSPLVSDQNRNHIFDAWAKYWDLSAPVLLEKSPPHLIKMRFFQRLFTPERTRFVMTIRHPLACFRTRYTPSGVLQNGQPRYDHWGHLFRSECGETLIKQWLKLYRAAMRDMQFIENVVIVQYEDFLSRGLEVAQGYVAELEDFFHLRHRVTVHEDMEADSDDGPHPPNHHQHRHHQQQQIQPSDDEQRPHHRHQSPRQHRQKRRQRRRQQSQQQRLRQQNESTKPGAPESEHQPSRGRKVGRRLQHYHGDPHHVRLRFSSQHRWLNDFHANVKVNSPTCKRVFDKYEDEVRQFGYSLKNLTFFEDPQLLRPWLLKNKILRESA